MRGLLVALFAVCNLGRAAALAAPELVDEPTVVSAPVALTLRGPPNSSLKYTFAAAEELDSKNVQDGPSVQISVPASMRGGVHTLHAKAVRDGEESEAARWTFAVTTPAGEDSDGAAAPTLLGVFLMLLVAGWFIGTWLMIRRHAGMRVWKSMEDTVKATEYYSHSFSLHPDLMERDKEAKLARVAGHDTTNMVWGDHRDAMMRQVASGVSMREAHSSAQQQARMMRHYRGPHVSQPAHLSHAVTRRSSMGTPDSQLSAGYRRGANVQSPRTFAPGPKVGRSHAATVHMR